MKIIYITLFFIISVYPQKDTVSFLDHSTRNYDQKHIKLNLSFDFYKAIVFGEAEFTFSPLNSDFNKLILHSKTTEVSSVNFNNNKLEFYQDANHLYINFDNQLSKGEDYKVIIEYASMPSRGMYFFTPTENIPEIPYQIWTQGQDNFNRHWYPAYDLPDDKLTSELIIKVPNNMKAFSNGVLLNELYNNDGTKTFHWFMETPYSNYLTTLIVGEFEQVVEKVRGTDLEYNVPAEWKDKTDNFFGRTPQMLNFFSDFVIPYPYKRYAQTTVQDFEWGGMENVTSTTLNKRVLYDNRAVPNYSADGLVAHELAHQWFGDILTCHTWDHIWLNEGFATYFTDLWFENEFGVDEFRYMRINQNENYMSGVTPESLEKIKKSDDEVTPVELSGGKAYSRGAAILNMLRFELGDEDFQKGIKEYVIKYYDKTVVSENLREMLEDISGKNLEIFFNQWVYGSGFPEFEVSYEYVSSKNEVHLKVIQNQNIYETVGIFNLQVPIEIISGREKINKNLHITKKEETFIIKVTSKPEAVYFNKYFTILAKTNFKKSFDELVYQANYDDDVTGRILAVRALKDFGKDAVNILHRILVRDNFYGVKLAVVNVLKEIGSDEVWNSLMIATEDFDARVREEAVKALSIFNEAKVGAYLISKLNKENNFYVQGAAAFSIGKIKMRGAFEILKSALSWDSHRNIIRRGVFDGFKELGDPECLPLIKEYIQYKYSTGGMHLQDIQGLDAAFSFAKTNRNEVIEVISSALDNPYFRTRIHAAKLLAELNAKEILPKLKNIYENDRRIVVREQLIKSINSLESN